MSKISVIMPCFLGDYPNSATNREAKFKRAVDSFLSQNYSQKELIIISDGCERTIICASQYAFQPTVKVIQIPKQELFSGVVRNTGLFYSTGQIICYLDADDYFGSVNHLTSIVDGFNYYPDTDWLYFDDQVVYSFNPTNNEILAKSKRDVTLDMGIVGTSSIAHKKLPEFNWNFCNGYGHDWTFIQKLLKKQPNPPKIDGCEYFVCHIPNSVDS